jgi:hypothetical protein
MIAVWVAGILVWWPCCYIAQIENVSRDPDWSTYAPGWLGLWTQVNSLPAFWFLLLLVPPVLFLPQLLRAIW